jgi:nitrogen fixation-related uncharacterized protein
MTLTTLITVNAVLAAIILYAIVWLHAHGVRHDHRHAESHLGSSLQAAEPARERDRIAA